MVKKSEFYCRHGIRWSISCHGERGQPKHIKYFIRNFSVQIFFPLMSLDNKYLYVWLGHKINHRMIEYAWHSIKIKQSINLMPENPQKNADKYQRLFKYWASEKLAVKYCFVKFPQFLFKRKKMRKQNKTLSFINMNNFQE